MSDHHPRRTPTPGRARKRAIREHAAQAGVAYSVAARHLEAVGLRPGETLATYGRTIYPIGFDPHRQLLVERRERRSFEERVSDTRRAAVLPHGRAEHLVERFPPSRGRTGSGVGPLYQGEGREELLAMLYVVIAAESPGLLPEVGDLAWIAELGEDTALDTACAEVDREARRLLDQESLVLWSAIEKALAAAERSADWQIRQEAIRQSALFGTMMTPCVGYEGEPYVAGLPSVGARQILDALLIVADDGHAPGTRVRLLRQPHEAQSATVIGATWGSSGPPVGYLVWPDGATASLSARAEDLVVLADQEALPR
ncbi:hypothetical protein [Micromonospora chokoriensis]|uniref:hypothetical protein n=1 Tax=Micromonospora chokoriensis TaxID=356851 RepID=UPI0012FABD75|nr:hypothetical protein [Micromonospora chokoriensis]